MKEEKLEKISSMKECLIDYLNSELHPGSVQCLSEGEPLMIAGEIVDMIKDLADAEKNCLEAKYYKTVTSAMEEYGEEGEERSGYNNRRYADGRYAPSGRGSVRGYHPPMSMYMADNRYGYSAGSGMGGMSSGASRSGYDHAMMYEPSDQGRHYDDYRMAKRFYTETRSEEDKKRMREHADEYVTKTVAAMLDIWNSADPEQKRHIKNNMTPLINGMNS